jgi:hypothetical protein
LEEHGLVTRRIQRRSQDGRYTRPVFFIHAAHLVSAPHRVKKLYPVDKENPDRGTKPTTANGEEPHRGTKPATVNGEKPHRGTKPATANGEKSHRGTKPTTVNAEKKPDRGTKPASSIAAVAAAVGVGETKQQQQQAKPAGKKLATGQAEADPEAAVFTVFAEALGRSYQPTARDRQHLQTLLADGHYCVPALQEQGLPPLSVSPAAPAATSPVPVPALPAEIRHDLSALGWSGAPDEVARHYHLDPDRVTALLDHWLHHQDQTIRSRAALFRTDLRAGNWPPENAAAIAAGKDGQRYIQGQYAAYIQH